MKYTTEKMTFTQSTSTKVQFGQIRPLVSFVVGLQENGKGR